MAETFFDRITKSKTTHTPDVLSCLANLSNDEVFTSPDIANQMLDLLPQELFSNPNTTFLDPACKTGVFLREIAKRLLMGLQDIIPDLQERIDHIFHKQLFGIAITELTSLLSRRSLYCSKYPNGEYSISRFATPEGNIRFRRINHVFVNKKCKYCGGTPEQWERGDQKDTHAYEFIHTTDLEKIFNMKFDVIISNPPYQLNDGGGMGSSAMPIYHKFIQRAKKLNPRYLVMITPSRWFSGGKGLDEFRNEMLHDTRIKKIHDFLNAADCFPGIKLKGGVSYFLWESSYRGRCEVITHKDGSIWSSATRDLLEKGLDVFIRYNEAISILNKVQNFNEKSFSGLISNRNPFGFASNFSNYDANGSIKIYTMNRKEGYLNLPINQIKNDKLVPHWKVYVAKAIGTGDISTDKVLPFIGEPNSICTETYLAIAPLESKRVAENVVTYINTKFFHFFLGLKKITQNTTSSTYSLVPMQDFSKPWTDEELYAKYNLTQEEINFIESMIRPME